MWEKAVANIFSIKYLCQIYVLLARTGRCYLSWLIGHPFQISHSAQWIAVWAAVRVGYFYCSCPKGCYKIKLPQQFKVEVLSGWLSYIASSINTIFTVYIRVVNRAASSTVRELFNLVCLICYWKLLSNSNWKYSNS